MKVKLKDLKANPNNPRYIRDEKFEKLKKSIQDFPEMLKLRPVVIDDDMMVLGGNMRLKALTELGIDEVEVIKAKDLTEKQKAEFIIKDNVGFGDWDWDMLANEWDNTQLGEWGLDLWNPEEDVDYSLLDDEDLSSELSDMTNGVKKAIQIEFELEHYDEAAELVKFWREQGAYVGGMIIEYLKNEKNKIKS
jgi:hypothetical protein